MNTTLYPVLTVTKTYDPAVDEILCEDGGQIFVEPSTDYYIAKES